MILRQILSQVRFYRARRLPANPGIEKRLQLVEPDEEFDDLDFELDLNNANKTPAEHRKDLQDQKIRIEKAIIREKYFKKVLPNFLTWAEKEQIRQLHRTDPEEWNYDKLSSSFPALPSIIEKVVQSHWKPKSDGRVLNHDKHVEENWSKFKKNELEIDPEFSNHLGKFLNRRNIKPVESESKEIVYDKPSKPGEFLSIVQAVIPNVPQPEKQEMIADPATPTPTCLKIYRRPPEETKEKNKLMEMTTNASTESEVMSYQHSPEQIKIPRKVWEKGKTYRVFDSYYDDDGEFLYRVPGMTGRQV